MFIGSTAAWGGIPTLGAYCGSKSALRGKFQEMRTSRTSLTIHKGAVETLQLEVAPFCIRTLLVEPGFFRTELLNNDNAKYVETAIEDYKPVTEALYGQFRSYHRQQPGNTAKGVQRIVDVVKGEGKAAGRELPEFLALGGDAVDHIKANCEMTLAVLEQWKDVSSDTTFD